MDYDNKFASDILHQDKGYSIMTRLYSQKFTKC